MPCPAPVEIPLLQACHRWANRARCQISKGKPLTSLLGAIKLGKAYTLFDISRSLQAESSRGSQDTAISQISVWLFKSMHYYNHGRIKIPEQRLAAMRIIQWQQVFGCWSETIFWEPQIDARNSLVGVTDRSSGRHAIGSDAHDHQAYLQRTCAVLLVNSSPYNSFFGPKRLIMLIMPTAALCTCNCSMGFSEEPRSYWATRELQCELSSKSTRSRLIILLPIEYLYSLCQDCKGAVQLQSKYLCVGGLLAISCDQLDKTFRPSELWLSTAAVLAEKYVYRAKRRNDGRYFVKMEMILVYADTAQHDYKEFCSRLLA